MSNLNKTLTHIQKSRLTSLQSSVQALPWNFQAHLLKKPVQNLDCPVDKEKYFNLTTYISLFKDYAESLQSNDYNSLVTFLEPSFAKKVGSTLERAH